MEAYKNYLEKRCGMNTFTIESLLSRDLSSQTSTSVPGSNVSINVTFFSSYLFDALPQ